MAIIRSELRGCARTVIQQAENGSITANSLGVYDGIVETPEDLNDPACDRLDMGSLMLCLSEQTIYVKGGDNTWIAIGP